MDFPLRDVWGALQQWGPAGLIILAMGWWIVKIERDKAGLVEKLISAFQKGADLATSNTEATNKWVTANEVRTKALDATVDVVKTQGLILAELKEAVRSSSVEVSSLIRDLTASHNRLREGLIEFRGRLGKGD